MRCCRLCNLHFRAEQGRLHGPTFRCTTCESSLRQIRRNMDRNDLDNFSVQEQRTFFQQLQEEKKKRIDGRLPWSTVRASLITAMTTRSVTGYKSEVQGKKLPMDVWMAKPPLVNRHNGSPMCTCIMVAFQWHDSSPWHYQYLSPFFLNAL